MEYIHIYIYTHSLYTYFSFVRKMSESHVHVTAGFPFSEILVGHLVCLSSFALCLLTSTLGISGQAAKRPQVCLF